MANSCAEKRRQKRERERAEHLARVAEYRLRLKQPQVKRRSHRNWWAGNYVILRGVKHPLAWKNGYIAEHQMVLYDKIGLGPHLCHWGCGRLLHWRRGLAGLTVDHLNWDSMDNRPENLVPACWPCNKDRKRPRV